MREPCPEIKALRKKLETTTEHLLEEQRSYDRLLGKLKETMQELEFLKTTVAGRNPAQT